MERNKSQLIKTIAAHAPILVRDGISALVQSLPMDKARRVPPQQLQDAIIAAASISPEHPFAVKMYEDGRKITLTIIGHDHFQLFSIFSGILAAFPLEITEGSLITVSAIGKQRLIIDHFSGTLTGDDDPAAWIVKVEAQIATFYQLLENNVAWDEIQKRLVELVSPSLKDVTPSEAMLDPIRLTIKQLPSSTLFQIRATDTPFFLFSLSTVINLHHLNIVHVFIETRQGMVIDSIECTDRRGLSINDEAVLNRIKLSILITKQFTFFLDKAPDPTKALLRFGSLIQNQMNVTDDLLQFLASSHFHGKLGRLLGTSDFLWEDFIRIQQDNIIPLLKNQKQLLSHKPEETEELLATHIAAAEPNVPAQAEVLNHFKNRESFLIDMDHIMVKNLDFFFLSHRLSALADTVVRQACAIAWASMIKKYGHPRTAGGMVATWAVFGLGKLGGQALGYASDLEILFIFADNGETDGEKTIVNRDFFGRFFKQAAGLISAKKKGIFQVDLRLRPYGTDGPVAVKLDAFHDYFHADGAAHSAERLALVRLRQIGGDKELGSQCLALRDHIVYESDAISIPEIRKLRAMQLQEKTRQATINAKFSPGGLVDLEYNVQILQVIHGRNHEGLRGPGIHSALHALNSLGTIDQEETSSMIEAYRFFRNIINGLRILRSNAEDLFLPQEQAREFRHLARRIGYKKHDGLSESEQLKIDFETHRARIRQFVERHLGSDAIPGKRRLTIVDILLTGTNDSNAPSDFFTSFHDPQRALVNIQNIAARGGANFIRLVILAWNRISQSIDPDMALNNWEQFTSRLHDPGKHFVQLLSKPARMDILFKLFARSQFLADILIQNPGLFRWATDLSAMTRTRTQIDMERELGSEATEASDRDDWCDRLRRARKKEILRIGLRDIALGVKIEEIMGEISFLARSCVEIALHRVLQDASLSEQGIRVENLSILAFGKLGGWELNYSSDIDLLCVYQPDPHIDRDKELRIYTKIFRSLVQDLSNFTQEGQAYRIDMRLRPYGDSGALVSSLPSIMEYYKTVASPWEFQALIKLKPIAGNLVLGEELLEHLKDLFHQTWEKYSPLENIASMRAKSITHHVGENGNKVSEPQGFESLQGYDIKNNRGGIRDIEFFLQGQQMLHSKTYSSILTGNTLRGLYLLQRAKIIPQETAELLSEHYRFFRRVEHYLQLSGNRQLHCLPTQQIEFQKLIRCITPSWQDERFVRYLRTALREVHKIYTQGISAN